MAEEQLDRLQSALADRYAVQRKLGSGGMATVYLAEDIRHERHVALPAKGEALAGMARFEEAVETQREVIRLARYSLERYDRVEEHYLTFLETFTQPDPAYVWMVTEARASLEELAAGR